jgi:hypothetical protein
LEAAVVASEPHWPRLAPDALRSWSSGRSCSAAHQRTAAIARDLNADLPDVPADELQSRLRAQGVQLEWPMPDAIRSRIGLE